MNIKKVPECLEDLTKEEIIFLIQKSGFFFGLTAYDLCYARYRIQHKKSFDDYSKAVDQMISIDINDLELDDRLKALKRTLDIHDEIDRKMKSCEYWDQWWEKLKQKRLDYEINQDK